MNISKVAALSGLSAKMIRYYESIGLLPIAQRNASGYRVYTNTDVQRLQFIYQARQLGFSLEHIQTLVQLWQNEDRRSADVKNLVQQHVNALTEKINQLQQMKQQLEIWMQSCAGNQNADCAILNSMTAHH